MSIEVIDSYTRGGFLVYENSVVAVAAVSNVAIGIIGFNSTTDKLEVFYNGGIMNLNHYSISGDNSSILLTDWTCNIGDVFDFRVYKNAR